MRLVRLVTACALLAALVATAAADAPANSIGKKIDQLPLLDAKGQPWTLGKLGDRKALVVVFLGTQCPINNAYIPRLNEIQREYKDKGVVVLGINSNVHDGQNDIKTHSEKFNLTFPVVRDVTHRAADAFGAKRTPEAFVLDGKGVIRYQGRIDDQYGIGFIRPKALHNDLTTALNQVLEGQEVKLATTPVAGCLIARAPQKVAADAKVTFTKHVAPILQNRCQECHRPGQVAPMPLLSYDDATAWAGTIREVLTEKRMPPWSADPAHGQFRNDKRLSKEELETLMAWLDAGCPRGDDKDMPPAKKFVDGWNIGQPDLVLTMKDKFKVAAVAPKRGIPYKYFVVPTNFKEDMWVQAAECKPGARSVVHHIIVYVLLNGKRISEREDGIGAGFLVAWAPGDLGVVFPPGAAKKIPKGASLAFQMHYTPNGTEHLDQSSVGLVFAKEPPKHEVRTRGIAQQFFFIPPGVSDYKTISKSTFKQDAILWALMPHMHLRGKSFKYVLVQPNGERETLLSVPRYDFSWQTSYRLKEPLHVAKGASIECTALFDNSTGNPNNPDPTSWVRWGDQTWEEMMIGFIDYTYADKK